MSEREHDDQHEAHELYDEVPPRSIFAATWFRVLLVVIVVGVIGAVAIPYVLDFMNPPPTKPAVAKAPAPPPAAAPVPATTTPAPDKPVAAEKPAAPAPTTPPPATPVETKPAAPKSEPPKTVAAPAEKKTAMAVTETSPKPAASTAKKDAAKSDGAKAGTAKSDTGKADTATPETAKPAVTPKTDVMAKADTGTKSDAGKSAPAETAKPAAASKPATTAKRAAATSTTTASRPATTGPFWVQVGAFRDAETAKKVAAKLRDDKFNVEESTTRTGGAPAAKPTPTPAPAPAATAKPDIGADQYDVFVTGQTPEELNKRLASKGLAAEASGTGMVVKPSLPLRDAVALSKDLAVEGFKVQVRRAGGSMVSAAPAPVPSAPAASTASAGGAELHRVRVGAFADRAAAQEAVQQLEAKGYKPYIARGDQ